MLDPNPALRNGSHPVPIHPGAMADEAANEAVAPPARILLIRGCPRSGTTMLAELVNASPRAGIIFEYPIGQLVRDLEPVMAYGHAHRSLRAIIGNAPAAVSANEGVYYNKPRVGPLTRFPTKERFDSIVRAVVEASLAKRELEIVGSKTPGAIALADREALEPYFPRISYLFSVRNPLGTINSMLNRRNLMRLGVDDWPWGDVHASIAEYRQNVRLLLSHAAAYPDDVFVSKYEDLVAELDVTADRIARFLGGIEYDYAAPSPLSETGYLRRQPPDTRLVMTAEERSAVEAAFGGAIATWNDRRLTGPATAVVDALADCVDRMRSDVKYSYENAAGERHFLGLGWSTLQDDGVWSDAKRADLFFTVDTPDEYVIYLEASFYVPDARPSLTVTVDVDGNEAFRGTFIATGAESLGFPAGTRLHSGAGRKGIACGPLRLSPGRAHRMTFTVDDPRSPLELGISPDARKVAVMLHNILLTKA